MTATQFIQKLAHALANVDAIEVMDVKDRALMVKVDGTNLMIGVQECE